MAGVLDFGAWCFSAGGYASGTEVACEVCCSGIGALSVVVSGCCAEEMFDIVPLVAEHLDFDAGDFDKVVLDDLAAGFGCIGMIAEDSVVSGDIVVGFGCIGTTVVGLNLPGNLVTVFFAGLLRGMAAGFGCAGTVFGNCGPFGGLNVSDNFWVTAFAGFRNRLISTISNRTESNIFRRNFGSFCALYNFSCSDAHLPSSKLSSYTSSI
jgi:hypothetical protein